MNHNPPYPGLIDPEKELPPNEKMVQVFHEGDSPDLMVPVFGHLNDGVWFKWVDFGVQVPIKEKVLWWAKIENEDD